MTSGPGDTMMKEGVLTFCPQSVHLGGTDKGMLITHKGSLMCLESYLISLGLSVSKWGTYNSGAF